MNANLKKNVEVGKSYQYTFDDGRVATYVVNDIADQDYDVRFSNGADGRIRFRCPMNYGSIELNQWNRPISHYDFLEKNFDTILVRMGREDMLRHYGNFSASGDKYYSYREAWATAGLPFHYGAAMYHLMELIYYNEVRQTKEGWVHPKDWVLSNYTQGYNLSQYMDEL